MILHQGDKFSWEMMLMIIGFQFSYQQDSLTVPQANLKLRCFIVLVNKDGEQFD